MSLSAVCDAIGGISDSTTHAELVSLAKQCEPFLGSVPEVMDATENALAISAGRQRLMLWLFVDRLAKQHSIFLDALRAKVIALATRNAFRPSDAEWGDFVDLLKSSFTVLFGSPLVSLVLMQLSGGSVGADATSASDAAAGGGSATSGGGAPAVKRSQTALTAHHSVLRRTGAFLSKAVAVERSGTAKHTLQVKTLDSQMAMNVASSYAPARPVEMPVHELHADTDAPAGYMQSEPAAYQRSYEETRRKRLREIMERNREEQDRRQQEELLRRVRGDAGVAEGAAASGVEEGVEGADAKGMDGAKRTAGARRYDDYSDIQMPLEFPRDEYGVKRGNFPLGVRFIKRAIASCGGAVELDVLVNRLSSLASREAVAEFGNVREFLLIHSPTFQLALEKGQWIVRLVEGSPEGVSSSQKGGALSQGKTSALEPTWEAMTCPHCSKVVKGRNYARHENCRRCIAAQMAFGLHEDYYGRGPIAELAFLAKNLIAHRDTYDDGDVDAFADCLQRAAQVRRFRLSSPRNGAPILKAMRVVRDRWLESKGVQEMSDAPITASDNSICCLFRVFGRCVHCLPIAWIEMGDVIDMCHRFSTHVREPFNPPPRPADPRISLQSEYPGFLLCESEVDSEDDPSDGEDEFSDDEAPTFTFAPPVDVAETIFTAGFERDTKRLQHRMRTAPPLVLQRVLSSDGSQTQGEAYRSFQSTGRR